VDRSPCTVCLGGHQHSRVTLGLDKCPRMRAVKADFLTHGKNLPVWLYAFERAFKMLSDDVCIAANGGVWVWLQCWDVAAAAVPHMPKSACHLHPRHQVTRAKVFNIDTFMGTAVHTWSLAGKDTAVGKTRGDLGCVSLRAQWPHFRAHQCIADAHAIAAWCCTLAHTSAPKCTSSDGSGSSKALHVWPGVGAQLGWQRLRRHAHQKLVSIVSRLQHTPDHTVLLHAAETLPISVNTM
jgi:hypothetical protein